jgi:hypothetical protein
MTLKFNNGKIRLWYGISKKLGYPNIGIRFQKSIKETEIKDIYEDIKDILSQKYGKEIL